MSKSRSDAIVRRIFWKVNSAKDTFLCRNSTVVVDMVEFYECSDLTCRVRCKMKYIRRIELGGEG